MKIAFIHTQKEADENRSEWSLCEQSSSEAGQKSLQRCFECEDVNLGLIQLPKTN